MRNSVLIIGGGGREHSLAVAMMNSPQVVKVYMDSTQCRLRKVCTAGIRLRPSFRRHNFDNECRHQKHEKPAGQSIINNAYYVGSSNRHLSMPEVAVFGEN